MWFTRNAWSARRAKARQARPQLEPLEDRLAPATIEVTSTADNNTVDGLVTLREAIESVNGGANLNADVAAVGGYGTNDTINFNIAGAGVKTITLNSPLEITKPVTIDGYSQPGATANTNDFGNAINATLLIQLANGGGVADAIQIHTDDTTVKGLAIGGFVDDAIEIQGNDNKVQGNFLGTDATGTMDVGQNVGVFVDAGSTGNVIGGATLTRRNLISGNHVGILIWIGSDSNTVQGNYVGTDKTGATALRNDLNGVRIYRASHNRIGGVLGDAGNLISGNGENGVLIEEADSSLNIIEHNRIGTKGLGTEALPNGGNGVAILGAQFTTIGGDEELRRNLISGNTLRGVLLAEGATTTEVIGNYIGTKANGTEALKNGGSGVAILDGASLNFVGGTTANLRNIISGNGGPGVKIFEANGNKVEGNFIGTDVNGTMAVANFGAGVYIQKAAQNTIGAVGTQVSNVISGNDGAGIWITGAGATQNKVQNNYVGTDVNGGTAVKNNHFGIFIDDADSNTIGGTTDGEINVISGNGIPTDPTYEHGHGIVIMRGESNKIQGNYIGTKANGTQPLGNARNGIYVGVGANDTTIGNAVAAAGNVISGNGWWGVEVVEGVGTGTTGSNNKIGKDKTGTMLLPNTKGNIKVWGSPAGVKISANNIGGGAGPSIDIASAIDVQIEDNLIEDSQGDAIKLDGASLVSITGNTITNNVGRGLYAVNSTDVTVGGVDLGNTITANNTGVDISGGSVTLLGNTISNHVGRGLFIHDSASEVTVGGLQSGEENSISGNGDDALVFASGIDHQFLSNHVVGDMEIWAGTSVDATGQVTGDASLSNAGTFTVVNLEPFGFQLSGDFTQTAGAATVISGTTTLDVTGYVDLAGGTLTIEQGSVVAPGGLTVESGAVLAAGTAGSADLVADVVNAGTITVGGAGSIGILSIWANASLGIGGHYTQTASGTLYMELAGAGDYDTVAIAGTAVLDGLLSVDLLEFAGMPDDTFTLLDNQGLSSVSGTFDGLPEGGTLEVDGLSFEISYQGGDGNDVVLTLLGSGGSGGSGGSIGDFVWEDLDGDGLQDPGEPGLSGVTVNLLDGLGNWITSTTSDGNGFYQFNGLLAGDYIIEFVAPTSYTFTDQDQGSDDTLDSDANTDTGRTAVITLDDDEFRDDIDAGLIFTGSGGSG
jgi:hypothetical protein